MKIVGDETHRYGRHYTPADVAAILAAFAIRGVGDRVFDPSCGDGRLLRAALARKTLLRRGEPAVHDEDCSGVFGVERFSDAVAQSALTGACVAQADFFDVTPGDRMVSGWTLPARFDAIIGNPPYIRQEVIGSKGKKRIEERLVRARRNSSEMFWPEWSRRSDIYVYFFAYASCFLRSGGRLAFLTASSWLDAGYGVPLREFLLKNFCVIAVIESAVESFFTNASINTSITVLAREPDAAVRDANPVRFVQLNAPLAAILGREARDGDAGAMAKQAARFVDWVTREPSPDETVPARTRVVRQAELLDLLQSPPGEQPDPSSPSGWGKYLRADEVFFKILERSKPKLRPLDDLARVRFGIKTGANEFFYVRGVSPNVGRAHSEAPGILKPLGEVASVRRGLTTGANEFFYLKRVEPGAREPARAGRRGPGSNRAVSVEDGKKGRHLIESEFLTPVVFSLKEIDKIDFSGSRTARLFFNCPSPAAQLEANGALAYIRQGERAGYDRRPTCAARDPWYRVARNLEPAPLIFPSKVGERWLVALNRGGVLEDKKLYGVIPRHGVSATILAAMLNSTWSRYYAELTCRQMTGAQAIADIDVVVAQRIPVPDPRLVSRDTKKALESALAEIAERPVGSIFDELDREDRRKLDEAVLEAMGFADASERAAVLEDLYSAVRGIVSRRLSKKSGDSAR